VTINQSTGIIGGTPNANGTYTVLVAAANDDGIAFMQFQIIVIDRPATATNTGSSGSSNSDEPNLDPRTPVSGNILVNEQAAKLQIIPNNSANGLTVDATGWSLDLVGKGIDGNPTKLSPKSEIIVVPGQGVATTGTGFKPNSPVKVYIFSSPTLLGTLTTDANGKFTSTLPLPKDLAVGTHQIQVNGISPENLVRSATVPALVEDTSATKSTTSSTTAAIASKQAVIPFGFNLFQIGSTQLKAIQALSIPKKGKLLINGYAQPTSGQDDIRISLDRAIEVKKYLAKVLPNVTIEVMGLGTKRQSLCSTYKNKCAIVKVVA